jgi:hypothetical protein
MEKIIRFKRNWEESFIRVCVIEGCVVEIDTPLYLFYKRFSELVEIPSIRWNLPGTAKKKVEKAIREAFDKTLKELTEETIRV